MSLFGRYVFRQAGGAFLLIVLSLTGIVWIGTALKQLNLMTSQGQGVVIFLKMTLLALPNLMALIAPIALLIAAMHTLNRLNGDSELIVLASAGAPIWFVARPLLTLAVVLSLLLGLMNHFVKPWSLRQLREYVIQVRTDLIGQVIQPGRFTAIEKGLTFHIRARDFDSGDLLGIIMRDARNPKEVTTVLAERADLLKEGKATYLIMNNGHIVRRINQTPALIAHFEKYPIDLASFGKKDAGVWLKPRERYFDELVNPKADDPAYIRLKGRFRSELHERFASPLYPFAFVMIVLAFVGQAQTTRQNRVQAVILAFLTATGCRLLGLAATNLTTLNAWAVPLVYVVPIFATLFATGVAYARMSPQRWHPLVGRLRRALEPIERMLAPLRNLFGRTDEAAST